MSNCYLGALAKAMEFQKAGYKMTGLKEVKGRINPWSGKFFLRWLLKSTEDRNGRRGNKSDNAREFI